jgi:hypothetical protein
MSAQDVFVIVHCPSPPYFVEGGDFRDSVKLKDGQDLRGEAIRGDQALGIGHWLIFPALCAPICPTQTLDFSHECRHTLKSTVHCWQCLNQLTVQQNQLNSST